jgi:hypothetical protein
MESVEEGAILVLVRLTIELKQMGIFHIDSEQMQTPFPHPFPHTVKNILQNVEPVPSFSVVYPY